MRELEICRSAVPKTAVKRGRSRRSKKPIDTTDIAHSDSLFRSVLPPTSAVPSTGFVKTKSVTVEEHAKEWGAQAKELTKVLFNATTLGQAEFGESTTEEDRAFAALQPALMWRRKLIVLKGVLLGAASALLNLAGGAFPRRFAQRKPETANSSGPHHEP
jgi:hypothetical protein